MNRDWVDARKIMPRGWTCGHCGKEVGGNWGYRRNGDSNDRIYICPRCNKPTMFIRLTYGEGQYPPAAYDSHIDSLPKDIEGLHDEICQCMSIGAYTSATLSLRKLLMHVAVDKGAGEGLSFAACVNYLEEEGYITPNMKTWVDAIRTSGNEANHQIVMKSHDETEWLLKFCDMLLKILYEYDAMAKRMKPS